jgi:aspartyl-tRNA(Asn)/glutamyl-tRNA(Gln) amidotransferase subunit A
VIGVTSASALELLDAYRSRRLSPVEVLDAVASRLEQNAGWNAFVTLDLEGARLAARRAEAAYADDAAERPPLLGVPVAVKDCFDTRGLTTTYGSPIFAAHVPAADAACVARLRAAGAVLVGKTSMYEFAWGITSDNLLPGPTANPWDRRRTAGGSSSGSAVALALDLVPLAVGSDTAGSIRLPAAWCGIVGHRPTHGRVDAGGAFPLAPSLDTGGPLARTPADARLLLDVLSGGELRAPEQQPSRLRVGYWPGPADVPVSRDVADATAGALDVFGELAESVVEVVLPAERLLEAFQRIQLGEALDVHRGRRLFPEQRERYSPELVERLERAGRLTRDDAGAAARRRAELRAAFTLVFERVDVVVAPAAPTAAPLAEDARGQELRDRVLPYTVPASLAGVPACAVRAGFDRDGLPIGLQILGPWGCDEIVLEVASRFFDATRPVQGVRLRTEAAA